MDLSLVETAVAVFVKNGKVLFEKRVEGDAYAGFLTLPGGARNPREPLEETLRREMREELGVEVKEAKPLLRKSNKDPITGQEFLHHFFLVRKYSGRMREKGFVWISGKKFPHRSVMHWLSRKVALNALSLPKKEA
jgi:8-oxo-dGTP pyrophosphatase MutT (NUDIX family)